MTATVHPERAAWRLQATTRILALGRVSTKEQAGPDKVSLKEQEAAVRAFADGLVPGARVEWREDPGVSGLNRDRIEEIVQACEAAPQAGAPGYVVVYDLSRFSRLGSQAVFYYLQRLEDAGWQFRDTTLKLTGAALADAIQIVVAAELAAEHSRMLQRKVPVGMKAGVKLGKWQGGPAPYGYDVGPDRKLVPNADAGVVRKLYAEFVAGARVVPLAQKYGLKPTTVRWLLDNPVYRGALVWGRNGEEANYVENPKAHEPIVDAETWNRAHDILSGVGGRGKHVPHQRSGRAYALSGLIRCPRGHDLVGGGGVPRRGPYAHKAQQYRQLKCRQCGVSVNEARLEETAGRLLAGYTKRIERVLAKEIERLLKRERGGTRAVELAAERAGLEEQRNRIVGAIGRGVLSEDDAAGQLADVKRRLADVTAQEAEAPGVLKDELDAVLAFVRHFDVAWREAYGEERRTLFRAFVAAATITADGTLTLTAHPPAISSNSQDGHLSVVGRKTTLVAVVPRFGRHRRTA